MYIPFKENTPFGKYVTGDDAFEAVFRDDEEALLSVSHTTNAAHEYCDFLRGTRVTLLGLCIMRRATRCMWVTLMHTNACPDDACLWFGVQFMRSAIPMTMSCREFCPYQRETLDVLIRYDLRCAHRGIRCRGAATKRLECNAVGTCQHTRMLARPVRRRFEKIEIRLKKKRIFIF
jgi:hypothetical protein